VLVALPLLVRLPEIPSTLYTLLGFFIDIPLSMLASELVEKLFHPAAVCTPVRVHKTVVTHGAFSKHNGSIEIMLRYQFLWFCRLNLFNALIDLIYHAYEVVLGQFFVVHLSS
jgi:hypothetical protein